MTTEYTQPTRTVVPSYPTISSPPRVTQVVAEMQATPTLRKQTLLEQMGSAVATPTLGVRGDGSVGAVGPAVTDPVRAAVGPGSLPHITYPTNMVPLTAAPFAAPSLAPPTMAEIPGYQSAPDGQVTVMPGTSIDKPVPWALVVGAGVVGVLGVGIGLYALTR